MTLDRLRPGDSARILALEGTPAQAQRLAELGILDGETVEVLAVAPLGDPLEIRVLGAQFSIRKADAARVSVRPTGDADG